jgi:5-methylcytosine-specific restriction endonuclease McrA
MNDFVSTVMNNGLVPGLIMYQLAPEDKIGKNEGKSFEMVDGQHRLFTLKAFMESTLQILPHISKPFIVYWNYENILEDGITEYSQVFYKETNDVVEWCRENKIKPNYFTEEEKEHFDHFGINITLIRSKLLLNQRREIFMSLQKGIPVRNSDFLKNKTDCKLVAFMSENNYEQMMTDTFFEHCYKKASNYWVHWVCRCFLLYKHFHNKCHSEKMNNALVSEIFLIEDKGLKKLIEVNSPEFNPQNNDIIHDFDDIFRGVIGFLQKFDGSRLNPTQIFALFYSLCDESKNLDIILTHIPYISREGYNKEKRTMWESKVEREPRREYFNKCLQQFNCIKERAMPPDDRQIPKALKKRVWAKCVDGLCEICQDDISENEFEVGHIKARALGGQIDIDNLIPICFTCNRSMGTRNAYEFKKDVYPHLCIDE